MMLNRNILWTTVLFAALSLAMAGCLPGAGSGDNNDDSNVQTGNNGGGNNGGGNNGNGDACSSSEDCSYDYCNCTDGSVVNSRSCNNGACESAAQHCPSSCEAFGTEWDGTVSQLPEDDAGTGEDAGEFDAGVTDDAGSGGPQCLDGQLEDEPCGNCMDQNCCPEVEGCFESQACTGFLQCIQAGGSESDCASENPGGQNEADALATCQDTFCSAECQ